MVAHADKPELHIDTVEEWERWLEQPEHPEGVRLRVRKKNTTKPGITRDEAVDAALCFGWIDGQAGGLDEDYFIQSFTPRRPKSMWSQVNQAHVARLIEEGRMRPGGLAEVERAKADGRWDAAYRQKDAVPPAELQAALDASPAAAAAFAAQSSVNRFAMIFRISNLKKPASREARAALYVGMLERGETLR
ncbi:YdeI family protein [Amnibacterium flavum]|uniref:Bacteriocin-protection protein, YdeI/OmpD-associated family n=1 Tax=Amnibacterium flavum TaxID=2173173 RepID=A0A2V1HTB2_9MICO|nr:YdeI/OmpD-associated family protein [Amnibacterium flavum]PVZ93557.1 bacteriocin-protection protein, YdeI/OmpD-associated family [Amnibacterium flavum]